MNWSTRLFKLGSVSALRVRLLALWKLMQHPRTPRSVKWLAFAVIAYAVSPIDLIPDFIPVLGLLDDLLLLPLGIALIVRLTPSEVWQDCLAQAQASSDQLPRLWWGTLVVVVIWLIVLAAFSIWLFGLFAAA